MRIVSYSMRLDFPKHVPIDVAGEKRNFLRPNTFGKHWIKTFVNTIGLPKALIW